MNCVFGPYKISSPSFPNIEDNTFVDVHKTRRIAIMATCDTSITAPCEGAIALSQSICGESGCNIRWYECPGILGRTYTILPTPCGVTITSFEDGLLFSEGCNAADFGSATFCFGKIYTSAGEFTSSEPHILNFEFDGHSFTVEGTLGSCNEFLQCHTCSDSTGNVETFASLPLPPPEAEDQDVTQTTDEEALEIKVISTENQTVWHNVPSNEIESGIQCNSEVNVTSWGGTVPSGQNCISRDNPSVATLPSGHTIIAYEERDSTGLTQIRVAILKSSVQKNIVYSRKLSKGTLVNNPDTSQQTFEIFEEMVVETNASNVPINNLYVGFLSGPLVGAKPNCSSNCLYTVNEVTRTTENDRVKHTIIFTPSEPVVFPDQNDINNVSWFLADDAGSDIPPDSSNVITTLDEDLTMHKFPADESGVKVPVANPSIAVAKNNQMISSEQNIFLVYQAFEENQWRVYLRQIVLGGEFSHSPTYSAPYLFTDQSQTITTMSVNDVNAIELSENVEVFSSETTIFDDTFSYSNTESVSLESVSSWNLIDMPDDYTVEGGNTYYLNQSMSLCKNRNPPYPTGGCTSDNSNNTCRLEFGSELSGEDLECDTTGSSRSPQQYVKSFYSSSIPAEDTDGNGYLKTKLSVKFSIEQEDNTKFYPEAWLLMGLDSPTSDVWDCWRVRVERHNGPEIFGVDPVLTGHCNDDELAPCNHNCFIISLYNGLNGGLFGIYTNRTSQDGTKFDLYRRKVKVCVPTIDGAGDYIKAGWNTISVTTYLRGRTRVFKVFLNNDNNTNYELAEFRELDESTYDSVNQVDSEPITFGKYYGFGFINHDHAQKTSIDQVSLVALEEDGTSEHIFYEDLFDYQIGDTGSRHIINFSDGTNVLRYLKQTPAEPNTAWQSLGYEYRKLALCHRGLNSTYAPISSEYNHDHLTLTQFDTQFIQSECTNDFISGSSAFWSILKINAPTELRRNTTAPFDPIHDITIYTSFARGYHVPDGDDGQWGNIWFLLRQDSVDSGWHTGWRLRVRYYSAEGTYRYLLSIYDGDSSTGDPDDTPYDTAEVFSTSENALFDFTANNQTDLPLSYREATLPYFKVDITTSTTTTISISIGSKTGSNIEPSNYSYTLIYSFTGLPNKHFGTYYGLALMSGAYEDEFIEIAADHELNNRDFRTQPIIDHIQIRSYDDDPAPPTGACCRAIGGCEDTTESNCQSPDVWDVTSTCLAKDCTALFTYGASCRESDGTCFSSTALGVPSGFGNFVGGEWIEGKNCTIGDDDYRDCSNPTGSCCKPDATCSDGYTKNECEAYWGDNFNVASWTKNGSCSDISCPSPPSSTGACCIESFTGCYSQVTRSQCILLGGDYLGTNTDCTDCEGGCCHSLGCVDTYYYDCLSGYTSPKWQGNRTECVDITCSNPMSDCCFDDGQCGITTADVCTMIFDGTWGEGTGTCDPNSCAQPLGACCDPLTGNCSQLTQVDCETLGRTFIAGACGVDTCEQPTGACCVNNECSQQTSSACSALGGNYFGNNTQCLPNHCSLEDPYVASDVRYKPEDLWVIQSGDDLVTRVLYHMQEYNLASSISLNAENDSNSVDFMLMIDHNLSLESAIQSISESITSLSSLFVSKGIDAKFSLIIFGRGTTATPIPSDKIECTSTGHDSNLPSFMFDALQNSNYCSAGFDDHPSQIDEVSGGWTRSVSDLQDALKCWYVGAGHTAAYAAIQFGIEDPRFNNETNGWRTNSSKFIFLVTDKSPDECNCDECDYDSTSGRKYTNSEQDALSSLVDNNVVLIPAVCTQNASNAGTCFGSGGDFYSSLSVSSGWEGSIFNVNTDDYSEIFREIGDEINITVRQTTSTIMERSEPGDESSFLKKAEVIITYDGDLSDLWTFNKTDFEFTDSHAPFPGTTTKELSNFPFDLYSGKIYGVDQVHIQGQSDNWVSFGEDGSLQFDHPNVGTRASAVSDPILMSTDSTRPKVFVNNRNQVIVAYETYDSGASQISMQGTGDFYQNSITGPKGSRLQRFYIPSDFSFNHSITLDGEGVNQLCDFVIDNSDVTHIVWQSNRDDVWEIYYANSYDLFEPVRVTSYDSRSAMPSIGIEESGSIFVAYHDNRFGPFNIMLASKTEERILPLLEQDAYMASMRNNYAHYTNTIPVVVNNPIVASYISTGQLWGSKTGDSPGNDDENYIYKISQSSGEPSEGGDSGVGVHHIAFHPDGYIYGIRIIKDDTSQYGNAAHDQATLYLIDSFIDSDPEITQTSTIVGDLDLETWNNAETSKQTGRILGMDFDSFGRLWIYLHNRAPDNDDLASLKWIDTNDASVKAETKLQAGGVFISGQESTFGDGDMSFAIDSNNNFYWGGKNSNTSSVIIKSTYPVITNNILDPDGPKLATVNAGFVTTSLLDSRDSSLISIKSMTFNENDHILIASEDNDLFVYNTITDTSQFLSSLTTDSYELTGPYPVGTTSSIAFLKTSTDSVVSEGDYFHIIIEFYDNFAMSGTPYITIDSRNNLEAFITEESLEDPYDPYLTTGIDARGIYLNAGETGIVFFDSTQFRPGYSNLSVPYNFVSNQTYFPKFLRSIRLTI